MAQAAHPPSEAMPPEPSRAGPGTGGRDLPDDVVVLDGASWDDFQRLVEVRGERTVPRFAFLDGRLELMSPSPEHEGVKSMVGRLVEAWCLARDVDVTPYGSWLLQSKARKLGLEPDECYVLGDHDAIPAAPDLAIEVVRTHGGVDKLAIYRGLGVREVWFWRRGRFTVHVLGDDGYREVPASEALPGLDLDLLLRFVDVRPMTRAVREYRVALAAAPGDGC